MFRGLNLLRVFVVILAMVQPFLIYFICGDLPSMSNSWGTILEPLFIIINASTSYFLFDVRGWRFPSLFLLLLTAFSISYSILLHNIFAVLFFMSCVYSLSGIRRLRWYILLYSFSLFIWYFYGLFWCESFAIIVLCLYHLHLLYIRYRFNKLRGR